MFHFPLEARSQFRKGQLRYIVDASGQTVIKGLNEREADYVLAMSLRIQQLEYPLECAAIHQEPERRDIVAGRSMANVRR